jgi:6-phosphogluconolactonase
MSDPNILIFSTVTELAEAFTEYFVDLVKQKQGIFNLALSGGSTPKVWFESLAKSGGKDIPWDKIHFYWGDERCVKPDDEQSNYGMTKKYLFDLLSVPPYNIHRIQGESEPVAAAERYARELVENLPAENFPVFDLIILGMGEDGHTASIFPDQIELWNSPKYCVVAKHPETKQSRVSLTGNVINNARSVAFLVTGKNKANKVSEIIQKKTSALSYPASLVNPTSGKLTWFLDGMAGQKI